MSQQPLTIIEAPRSCLSLPMWFSAVCVRSSASSSCCCALRNLARLSAAISSASSICFLYLKFHRGYLCYVLWEEAADSVALKAQGNSRERGTHSALDVFLFHSPLKGALSAIQSHRHNRRSWGYKVFAVFSDKGRH